MITLRTLFIYSLLLASQFSNAQAISDGLFAMIYAEDNQLFLKLHKDKAPMTVANFVGLAEGTISNSAFKKGQPFFDGSSFDRVVPGHVIQGGVPDSELATNAGYTIPNEIHPDLNHSEAGTLGMANAGPDTGSNVFYITLGDRSYLDGDYTVFGKLITRIPHDLKADTRIDSIRILRIGKEAEEYHVDDKLVKSLIEEVREANTLKMQEKLEFEKQYIAENYPEAETTEYGWQFVENQKGKGKKAAKLESVNIRFRASTPQGLHFGSTSQCASYWIREETGPETCKYIPGETSIIKGLDQAIPEMKIGSKWTVILKPEDAYGLSGYYPPLDWGNKRFHISPNTTLIYEIELLKVEE